MGKTDILFKKILQVALKKTQEALKDVHGCPVFGGYESCCHSFIYVHRQKLDSFKKDSKSQVRREYFSFIS